MNRLYYESAYRKEFEARVLSCCPGKQGWEIILSATAFYPEGGGQPADTGILGGVRVTDVRDRNGQVVHLTDGPLTEGETVTGVIDWDRRFQHMQEHSGEHLVSGLIHQKFGYDNVGFHMGTDGVTIDFNGLLEWEDLMAIERTANGMIWENLEIRAEYPPKEALDAMEYRSKKELTGDVRIVTIPGGDVCACCGTHVERTGEIGLVKFVSMIHYKGGVRIGLLCGKRAVEDYERRREQTGKISVLLSAKPGEIAAAVEKMKAETAALQEKLAGLYGKLIENEVENLQDGNGAVWLLEPEFGAIQLRYLANRVLEKGKGSTVLTLGENGAGGYLYVLGSRNGDMRELSRELNGLLNGRGGGSAQMAQGTFFAQKEQIREVLETKGFISPAPQS